MKKWNWREKGRDRRRNGHRSDWHRDNRHRTQEQRYSGSDAGPSHRDPPSDSHADGSSSSSSSSAPELPGFYFDQEKNRYFRLLPGHNNCNPLTRELLQEREMEKQRSRLLTEDEKPRKKAPRSGLNSALLLQKRHLGLLPGSSYCRLIHEVKVSGMRRHRLEVQSSDTNSPNTDNFRLIVGDSACERVFTVNDVSHGGCKYGIMNFQGCNRGSLSVEMCDNLYFTNRKVNSICWASVTHSDSHVLLCLVGMAETPGCVSLLPASLFSNSNPDQPGMLCSFKISTAWSCAWCLNPQADKTFSTGLSRRVIVTDAVTGRRQTYGISSDVLAQQFALRAPVLFNGCRSGEIFSIDLRQRGRRDHSWKASRFHQDSAITSVRLLQDENYLLAADMLGQIKMWDVRVTRPVQQYKGHHNEHAYLPLHVNEPEGLLLAVGQDCYTRVWSLGDGQLLRTIPSPHPAGKDLIPSVVFSSQLGGRRGLPGLLMAVRHDLYYFPYNSDYQEGGEGRGEGRASVAAEAVC
ncbi:WD repeat domain 21 isoform X1 [Hypomesus transpacificus]|uniref:WD repeat domain 21 isoform X1 n=2 Tax=Hypomesus transpacificus TaxID=137520 RepID=UPI001F07740D|nr:WD repeat domain 21 isoform X1 [Hypomesus transpacificus]XP_046877496.1 WD repeat domain 21 isoform X1 [Hypomesus transpacificus]